MRLPVVFARLPLTLDAGALADEVAAIDEELWRGHPEGAPGNTALPLIAAHGDPFDDAPYGPMLPTPYLDALPYTRRVIAVLDSVIGRSRLMRIEEEGELLEHVDVNYYWRDHLRVHAPVITDPQVTFACGDDAVHMGAGEVWVFDTWRRHRVDNPVGHPRAHLVIDTVGSAGLWSMIDDPGQPARAVATDGPEPTLVTERVNRPAVVSPWEMQVAFDALLGDLAKSSPDLVDGVRAAFTPVLRAWRNAWARFGDVPQGATTYTQILREADAALHQAAGDARLTNHLPFMEALRHHALFAPNFPDAPTSATSAATAIRVRPVAPPPIPPTAPTFERPVFIVSSPRSGSSLLFETLVQSPDLFTIGGESHLVIEAIPALRPSSHDWESNRLDASDATPDSVRALRRGFLEQLRDRDGRPPTSGAVRMLEKTPKNSLRVPFLAAAFPDAAFIYLYRDPRETVSSMLDAWRSGRFVMYPDLPGWTGTPWSLLLVPGWRDLIGRPLAEIVSTQWANATTVLLDDLEALEPDRWCVASYDRLVADPQGEVERLGAFCDVRWDVALDGPLPLSRHTLDSPHPDKWLVNSEELRPQWDRVATVAARAHEVFAAPPRTEPVVPRRSVDAVAPTAGPAVAPAGGGADAPPEGDVPEADFGSRHTNTLPALLTGLGCSLLVSTYQSGRVIIVRSHDGELNTHFRAFPSPMGMAVRAQYLAIGTRAQVHIFQNQPAITPRLDPPDRHDACFMPRHTYTTGDVRIHDLAYAGDELWTVNTRFSCLATLDEEHSFVPRWRPPFISALAPEDRCHLNGLCVIDGTPRFVTALGVSDESNGWRDHKVDGGVLLDIPSGEVVTSGMCMPHSPRWHLGRLWLLESGRGILATVDPATGERTDVARVPGFARGLSFAGQYAFIGLSQVREHVFEGLPLTGEGVERNCGVWVVDVRTGETVAWLQFDGRVQEIYEVTVLPGTRYPEIVEPGAEIADTAFVLPDAALTEVPEELRA